MKRVNTADIGFEDKIWKAADKMRGNIEQTEDAEPFDEKMSRLTGELSALFEHRTPSNRKSKNNWKVSGINYERVE